MKKIFYLLTFFLFVILVTAGCEGNVEENNVALEEEIPQTIVPPVPIVTAPVEELPTQENLAESTIYPDSVLRTPRLASRLLGLDVVAVFGEGVIGTVHSLVLDARTATVSYVFVDADGQIIPIPWIAFDGIGVLSDDPGADGVFMLVIADQTLAEAPVLPQTELDNLELGRWEQGVRAYWSGHIDLLAQTGQDEETIIPLRLSAGRLEGIELDVENTQNEDLGDIDDFIISPQGQVLYAVMETDAFLDVGGSMLLVPSRVLAWDPAAERFLLPVDPSFLEQAVEITGFESEEDIPDLTTEGWDAEIMDFWSDIEPPVQEPAGQP